MSELVLVVGNKNYSSWSLRPYLALAQTGAALPKSGGPFLFGHFTIADAMFAPVTTRFTTYAVALDPALQAYVAAIAALPAFQAWKADAEQEPWHMAYDDQL